VTEKNGYNVIHFKVPITDDLSVFREQGDKSIDNIIMYAYMTSPVPQNVRRYCPMLIREMSKKIGVPFHDVFVQCLRHSSLWLEEDIENEDVNKCRDQWESQGDGFKTEVMFADTTTARIGFYKTFNELDDNEIRILTDVAKEEAIALGVEV